MTFKISSKYINNLVRIRDLLASKELGHMQENPQVHIDHDRGTCYYDTCCVEKIIPSEQAVIISYDDGRTERYGFHAPCLYDIIHHDRRILPSN